MPIDLYNATMQMGPKMNMCKTNRIEMVGASGISNSTVILGNKKHEVVDTHIYLGHVLSLTKRFQGEYSLFGQPLKSRKMSFGRDRCPNLTYIQQWVIQG